jgi:hypothetical protein
VQLFVRWKETVGGVEVIGITRLPIADGSVAPADRQIGDSSPGAGGEPEWSGESCRGQHQASKSLSSSCLSLGTALVVVVVI